MSNKIFISDSDNELEQVHLDLHLSGIVGHIESRHTRSLKCDLENTKKIMSLKIYDHIWSPANHFLDISKCAHLLIRDLLIKLSDEPHILLLSILSHPRLLGRNL